MSTLSIADAGALSPWREALHARALAARERPAALGLEVDPSAFKALDEAVGLTPASRLGCQAVIGHPKADVAVLVPRFTVHG